MIILGTAEVIVAHVAGLLVLISLWLLSPFFGIGSVRVKAECIRVDTGTAKVGTQPGEETFFLRAKRPVYRYTYAGKEYESSPLLTSNRPGYKPGTGETEIYIHPKHPERVYSSERRAAAAILLIVAAMFIAAITFAGRKRGMQWS